MEGRTDVLITVSFASSVLSALGSLFIISNWVLFPSRRIFFTKLIVCLSVANLISSAAYSLSFFSRGSLDASNALCRTQAVLTITFEMASVLWTVLKTHSGRSATGALNVPVPLAALAASRCQTVIVPCAHTHTSTTTYPHRRLQMNYTDSQPIRRAYSLPTPPDCRCLRTTAPTRSLPCTKRKVTSQRIPKQARCNPHHLVMVLHLLQPWPQPCHCLRPWHSWPTVLPSFAALVALASLASFAALAALAPWVPKGLRAA